MYHLGRNREPEYKDGDDLLTGKIWVRHTGPVGEASTQIWMRGLFFGSADAVHSSQLGNTKTMFVIELVANLVTIGVGVFGLYEVFQRIRRKRKPDELDPPKYKEDSE